MKDTMSFRPTDAQEKAIYECKEKNGLTHDADAIKKLLDEAINRYAPLDDACYHLAYEKDDYRCVHARIGKTPDIKKLGTTEQLKDKICKACKKDLSLKEKIVTLEEQVAKGYSPKIPQCARGAKLNEAMDEFNCPERGRWRPIIDRKKKTDYKPCRLAGKQNANCQYLSWITVKIKGKLPDGQNL